MISMKESLTRKVFCESENVLITVAVCSVGHIRTQNPKIDDEVTFELPVPNLSGSLHTCQLVYLVTLVAWSRDLLKSNICPI